MPILFSSLALTAYLAAAVGIFLCLRGAQAKPRLWRAALGAAGLALLCHAAVLWLSIYTAAGLALGIQHAVSLTGWLIALIVLFALREREMASVGVAVFPLVAVSVAVGWLQPEGTLVRDLEWPLLVHILSSLLAYSLFALAAVLAILLAIQDRQLRKRRTGGWIGLLPPLTHLESLLFHFLGVGFALLTLSLFSGFLFVDNLFAQHLAHKTVLSLCAWLIFGVLILGRWRRGWRGRRAFRWTLGGFALLALAYFGSKAVLELILQQHWTT
jgi:ABC-type uncharacterized transport system permease subunit